MVEMINNSINMYLYINESMKLLFHDIIKQITGSQLKKDD